jgi:hypothetical protein
MSIKIMFSMSITGFKA